MKNYKVYHNQSSKYLFLPYSMVENNDYNITLDDYELVCCGKVEYAPTNHMLENIFQLFNGDIVSMLNTRSLSVSDVIEIDGKFYYVDNIGFVEICL